jgi:phosphoadenosine phosphosulfate reductase
MTTVAAAPSRKERIARARRLLAHVEKNHSPAALASGFGAEDMVILDLIARDGLAIAIFTIDTGRIPAETHRLIAEVRKRYGLDIAVHSPWPGSVDAYVEEHGLDGLRDSVEARRACCAIRRTEPLRRALSRKRAWITGRRSEHLDARADLREAEDVPASRLWKFNPLADWTDADVWAYLRENRVPWNALHDQGYPSVGCEPCTRAVRPGEPPRSGRWWWERDREDGERRPLEIPVRVLAAAP